MLAKFFNKFKKSFFIERFDWITRHEIRFNRIHNNFLEHVELNKDKNNAKNVLFWSTTSWERGNVELILAYALKSRGHRIKGVLCEGRYDSCSMESVLFERPNKCEDCSGRIKKFLDIYKLNGDFEGIRFDQTKNEKLALELDTLSLEELKAYKYRGVEVGRTTFRDMPQYFFRLVELDDPDILKKFKKSLCSAILYIDEAYKIIEEFKPSCAIVTSGKTISFSSFFEVCRHLKIPVATWDEGGFEPHSFVFRYNDFANEYHVQEPWLKVKGDPLTEVEKESVEAYFQSTSKGNVGQINYYKGLIDQEDDLRAQLEIPENKKVLTLLTNITWDTSCLGRDVAFESMTDWVFKTIEEIKHSEDKILFIRCHPAEGNVPHYMKSQETLSDIIFSKYPELPPNVRVITGKEQYSSHRLCEMSDMILVYTTTVGLEMACRGRQVILCGESHYRGKGFTTDIDSVEQYLNLLRNLPSKECGEQKRDLAIKYANFFLFKVQTYIPAFKMKTRHEYEMEDPSEVLPGNSKLWDNLCDHVTSVGDFIGLSEKKDVEEVIKAKLEKA